MKIILEQDPSLDAVTIKHDAVHLQTTLDVNRWRTQLMSQMEDLVGEEKVFLLVDYDDFSVDADVADDYGRVAEELRMRFARDVFRYGNSDPHSFLSARLQSLKRAHRSNVFRTRKEAVDALIKARGAN